MAVTFSDSTQVVAVGPGRYEGNIDSAWNLLPLPQGGIVTATALRAMAHLLAEPGQTLRSMHTTYCAQVRDGPVDITVELLRRGRSMSQLRAEVANRGEERGHLTTVVFGAERSGFDFTDLDPPADVPPPAECRSFRDPLPDGVEGFDRMAFWDEQVEGRNVVGHPPWEDYVPDRAEHVIWYRFDEAPLSTEGELDPFALVVLSDTMPGAVRERIGPNQPGWFAPSIDLTVHLLDTCHSPWVLAHNRARFAGHGYASADMALWDCGPDGTEPPRLVAYATQIFLFSFTD